MALVSIIISKPLGHGLILPRYRLPVEHSPVDARVPPVIVYPALEFVGIIRFEHGAGKSKRRYANRLSGYKFIGMPGNISLDAMLASLILKLQRTTSRKDVGYIRIADFCVKIPWDFDVTICTPHVPRIRAENVESPEPITFQVSPPTEGVD
ncbi:hypothetical protein RRF57_010698 [Xylaria bambusicola]|uniref:Uncharacterized protein n=1 Tax=Xylaria bambusicola TaxID=326684 RepID=A0AAN7ZCR0_9PEZI